MATEQNSKTAPPSVETESQRLTSAQRAAFWGSYGGWAMDGFNWTIFALVLSPVMTALLPAAGIKATNANVAWYGEISAAIFLFGWGCSVIWGPIADRFGRKPTMTLSILLFGVATALAGVSTSLWEWNAFRFVAAIGIGGEWAMAGTLLSEVMPERSRVRLGGVMHSAAYVGVIVVSLIYLWGGTAIGWRGMFFVGALPAVAVFAIRSKTPEPERWRAEKSQRAAGSMWDPVREILAPEYRGRTLSNLMLLVVCVIGLWAGSTYVPTAMKNLATASHHSTSSTVHLTSEASIAVAAFTVLGCFLVPKAVQRLGRRRALAIYFAIMAAGILGSYGLAYPHHSIALLFAFTPLLGIGGASFAVFTIWLPEQYPTRMRATAFAFTTTMSRWVAAAGTFLVGYGIDRTGSLSLPLSLTSIVFVIGIFLIRLAPETRGQAIPD